MSEMTMTNRTSVSLPANILLTSCFSDYQFGNRVRDRAYIATILVPVSVIRQGDQHCVTGRSTFRYAILPRSSELPTQAAKSINALRSSATISIAQNGQSIGKRVAMTAPSS